MKKITIYLSIIVHLSCTNNKENRIVNLEKHIPYSSVKSEIDGLSNTNEIIRFLKQNDIEFKGDKYHIEFLIKDTDSVLSETECKDIFKIWKIKNWEKVDIDNNGLTDLFFYSNWYGKSPFAFLDLGNKKYKKIRIRKEHNKCELSKPIKIGNKNALKFYREKHFPKDTVGYSDEYIIRKQIDTLIVYKNNLIELKKPAKYDIKSIKIERDICFGSCPEYKMEIENNHAEFEGISYTNFKGKGKKEIELEKINELFEIIERIRIKELKNDYQVYATDNPSAKLTIEFADLSTKEISDYGLSGTFGLRFLYSKLNEIAMQTEWEK